MLRRATLCCAERGGLEGTRLLVGRLHTALICYQAAILPPRLSSRREFLDMKEIGERFTCRFRELTLNRSV